MMDNFLMSLAGGGMMGRANQAQSIMDREAQAELIRQQTLEQIASAQQQRQQQAQLFPGQLEMQRHAIRGAELSNQGVQQRLDKEAVNDALEKISMLGPSLQNAAEIDGILQSAGVSPDHPFAQIVRNVHSKGPEQFNSFLQFMAENTTKGRQESAIAKRNFENQMERDALNRQHDLEKLREAERLRKERELEVQRERNAGRLAFEKMKADLLKKDPRPEQVLGSLYQQRIALYQDPTIPEATKTTMLEAIDRWANEIEAGLNYIRATPGVKEGTIYLDTTTGKVVNMPATTPRGALQRARGEPPAGESPSNNLDMSDISPADRNLPVVLTREDYDKLEPGARYIGRHPETGKATVFPKKK